MGIFFDGDEGLFGYELLLKDPLFDYICLIFFLKLEKNAVLA
jgi:hypothetical protein